MNAIRYLVSNACKKQIPIAEPKEIVSRSRRCQRRPSSHCAQLWAYTCPPLNSVLANHLRTSSATVCTRVAEAGLLEHMEKDADWLRLSPAWTLARQRSFHTFTARLDTDKDKGIYSLWKLLLASARKWEIHPQLSKEQFTTRPRMRGIDADHMLSFSIIAALKHSQRCKTLSMQITARRRDPLTLIDMEKAVARILQALENDEHITVYGDYDADGVTSSALLFRALRTLINNRRPPRFSHPSSPARGLRPQSRRHRSTQSPRHTLIITTDCASSDVEQVAYASTLGIDVIITDHHNPPEDVAGRLCHGQSLATGLQSMASDTCVASASPSSWCRRSIRRSGSHQEENWSCLISSPSVLSLISRPCSGENHTLVRLGLQKTQCHTQTRPARADPEAQDCSWAAPRARYRLWPLPTHQRRRAHGTRQHRLRTADHRR